MLSAAVYADGTRWAYPRLCNLCAAKNATNVEKAFLTMAHEIKTRIATQPNLKSNNSNVVVSGQDVSSSGGGCC